MTPAAATILIVDDELSGREILAALLRPQPYQLLFAASGEEALASASAHPPDLVLLDVMMPRMDGFDVCRMLRAHPVLAEVPIIIVTALDDRQTRLRAIEAGADDFITKPFDRVELRARIGVITRLNRYRNLLAERERFARVVEFAPDGLLIIDDGRIALANPAAARLLEAVDSHALVGQAFTAYIAPERYAGYADCLEHLDANPNGARCIETMLVAASGRNVPAELHAGRLSWNGRPAVHMSVRDISDRKRSELLEEEQHHLAFELHDGLAQIITSVHQHVQALASRYHPRTPEARAALAQALGLAQRAVVEVRQVIAGLRPTVLDDVGLSAALDLHIAALRDEGWAATYGGMLGAKRLLPTIETVIFRIALEALANVRKHAGCTRVHTSLAQEGQFIRLVVHDWGCGFATTDTPTQRAIGEGVGLRSIRERVALLGGSCQIQSAPGSGTTVSVAIPLLYTREADDGL